MSTEVDPKADVVYVLLDEREKEDQREFILRPLTSRDRLILRGGLTRLVGEYGIATDAELEDLPFEIAVEFGLLTLKRSLVGWKNFNDADGKPILFSTKNKDGNLDHISASDLEELSFEAQRISSMVGDEAKN